jgi:hypothetical protein
MNNSQLSEESGNKFRWVFAFLALLLLVGLVVVNPADLRRRSAEVRIDKNGTARLGGVLPLRNKKVRDAALRMASHLYGGKFAVVADKGAGWTNLVEVCDSIRKAGGNPSHITASAQDLQAAPQISLPPSLHTTPPTVVGGQVIDPATGLPTDHVEKEKE